MPPRTPAPGARAPVAASCRSITSSWMVSLSFSASAAPQSASPVGMQHVEVEHVGDPDELGLDDLEVAGDAAARQRSDPGARVCEVAGEEVDSTFNASSAMASSLGAAGGVGE